MILSLIVPNVQLYIA